MRLRRGYDLPRQDRASGTVPIVSSSGVTDFHVEAKVKGPGVITGRYGTIGEVFFVQDDFWPLNTTLYVEDFKGNDPRFISYFLRCLDFFAFSDKAAVPGVNRNDLHLAEVRIPPLAKQRAIAHILGTLDDRIELNRRMNETLEEMARALFNSWFVDLDPVRAKMKGRWQRGESLPGLPAHVYDLFPDRLVDSALGEIPEGWGVRTLGQCIDVVRGLSYKGSGLSSSGVPMHNLNSIYEGGGYKEEGIKYYDGDYKPRHMIHPGDVIVANTEQGHDRLLIGHAAVVPSCFGVMGLFSHHLYKIQPKNSSVLTSDYLCELINSPAMHDVVSGYATGTTVNMMPVDALNIPLMVAPQSQVMSAFDNLASNSRTRRQELFQESQALTALRDALLQKLVSGELRASEVGQDNSASDGG